MILILTRFRGSQSRHFLEGGQSRDIFRRGQLKKTPCISINHLLIYVNNINVYYSSSLILSCGKYQTLPFLGPFPCNRSFSLCPNLRAPGTNFHFNYFTLSKENQVQAARLQELGSRSGTFCFSVTVERSRHLGDVGIYRV